MAIYTTFFLSEPERLPTGFPTWKLPLPEAVTRTSFNPFTREEITITTRAPEWDDFAPENVEIPDYEVASIAGDYHTFLEQRIPPMAIGEFYRSAKVNS